MSDAFAQQTLSDVLFLAAVLAFGVELLLRREALGRLLPSLLVLGAALYAAGGIASNIGAAVSGVSMIPVARFEYVIVIWFLVGAAVLRRKRHITITVTALVLSAAIDGGSALLESVTSPSLSTGGRFAGLAGDPNFLGLICAAALFPAISLAFRAHVSGWRRAFCVVEVLCIISGVVVSGSVSSFVSVGVAGVLWLLFAGLRRQTVVAIILVGAFVVGALAIQQAHGGRSPADRVSEVTGGQGGTGSLNQRVDSELVAWNQIKSNPILGVGTPGNEHYGGSIETLFGAGSGIHNLPIGIWYYSGGIAFVGLVLIIASMFRASISSIRASASGNDRDLRMALLFSFVACQIEALAQPVQFRLFAWITGALMIAGWAVWQRPTGPLADPAGADLAARQHLGLLGDREREGDE